MTHGNYNFVVNESNGSLEILNGGEAGAVSNIVDGFIDYKGNPANKFKQGGIKATMFVFAMTTIEAMAFLGTALNLVTYIYIHMHYSLSESANILTNFMGTTFLLSLVGGFISDAYLTRSKTLFLFGSIEFLGFMLLTIQSHFNSLQPAFCNAIDPTVNCQHVRGQKEAVFFSGLYLVALGSGGLKAIFPTLGADQFDENDPKERRLISSFFNFLIFSVAIGSFTGVTLLVWLENNKGWDVGFIVASSSILFGLAIVAIGYTKFRNKMPMGSPLTKILQVFVASFKNRHRDFPTMKTEMYEEKGAHKDRSRDRLPHTHQFRLLDKATILPENKEGLVSDTSSWRLCTVTQVEEVKVLIRMVPIFASTVLMNTCLAQLQTFSVQQGGTMDKSLGKLNIPPASLTIIPTIFIIILAPLYDRFFVPFAQKLTGHETGITHLQRIGIGLVLATLSMVTAAIAEIKRKHVAEEHNLLFANPSIDPLPISVFMLSFQFFIFGIADLFTLVGLLEFFYSQAPTGFRSLGTSFCWCSLSMGYFLSSVLVNVVNAATRKYTASKGWLEGNNINVNHLDLFYWTLAVFNFLNFFNFLYWANWYKYRHVGYKSIGDTNNKVAEAASSSHGDSK
ncbi:protein NRT1/ PTR FAMILY 4.6-like [Tasmannia lanceolata]|uniref:protein NRT1/ PTR FAMILY 4.6-like n=1 Tax=Tasmannia lanceolata TaxID=3420 RepID=UPI00406330CD